MADSGATDVRMMENHMDLIEEVMNQPSSDDQRTMVNEMFRECAEHRKMLEQEALKALERDGGEAVWNQITMLLDRLERMKEDWQHRQGGEAFGGLAAPSSSPHMGPTGDPMPPPFGGQPSSSSFHGPSSLSPMSSAAAASEGDPAWRPASSVPDMGKDRKKKKDKKNRRTDGAEDLGFSGWPSASSGAVDTQGPAGAGVGAWGGDGAVSSSAAAWPSGPDATVRDNAGFDAPWGSFSAPAAAEMPVDRKMSGSKAQPSVFAFEEPLRRPPDGPGQGSHFSSEPMGLISFGDSSGSSHKTTATLHIRRPFSDVEYDREGFGKMFAQVASQAAGVPAHRIRIHAVRPGV